jgi:hypothetical protein
MRQFLIAVAEDLWAEFGDGTVACMQDGVHLLAVLWQSAWAAGGGDDTVPASALKALTRHKAMAVCRNKDFLPSKSVDQIGSLPSAPS